jgi:hypothetical protein
MTERGEAVLYLTDAQPCASNGNNLMYGLILPPFFLLTLAPGMSPASDDLTAAQVECSEQAGEFWKEGQNAYCEIDGVVYETEGRTTSAPQVCVNIDAHYVVKRERPCAVQQNRSTEVPKLRQN